MLVCKGGGILTILIDTENVSITTEEISQLDKTVELVLFVSKNSKNMSPYCLGLLNRKGIQYRFEIVDYSVATKNCLDLHLVIFLTKEIMSGTVGLDNEYFIYSKDSDFAEAVRYLDNLTGIKVGIISSLTEIKTKSKIISEKEDQIDEVVFKCVDNCSTMQEAYRFFVKELRSMHSLSEIATIYNEQKERLAIELDLKAERKEELNLLLDKEINKKKKEEKTAEPIKKPTKTDSIKAGISFKLDKDLWQELKVLLGQFKTKEKSSIITISYEKDTVRTSNIRSPYDLCTFYTPHMEEVSIGDVFELKCLKPKESSATKVPVTQRNKKQINRFLKIILERNN